MEFGGDSEAEEEDEGDYFVLFKMTLLHIVKLVN